MWKFILANFPFPIWFNDNPYLLARFFSEQLNGATIHALQADKSGEHMDDMEQIRKQQGHVSLPTECRQEDTKNLRTHVSATQSPVDRANTYASPLRSGVGKPMAMVFFS